MFELKLISGSSNPELAQEIAKQLGVSLTKTTLKKFKNGETYVRILENIRGEDVFVIQTCCQPVNDNLVELLLQIDALTRASAKRITAVVPNYFYARQDRKAQGREPISAKLVANLLARAGARRLLTIDLHASQIQGFFDFPADELTACALFAEYISNNIKDYVIVAPDMGGIKRARMLNESLNVPIAIVDKKRCEHHQTEIHHLIGEVKDKNCIIVDDMIDTGSTIIPITKTLKEHGCKDIYVFITHPVFSEPAMQNIEDSEVKEVIITNTMPSKPSKKVKVLSVAPLLAKAIKNIHNGESVSALFDKMMQKTLGKKF
jgi:ribose-phosphate pyrophosphokinase